MTDADAVTRVLAGEVDVYAVLVERYRQRFGRYALHMLGNREDAEEALQDAFVRGFRALAQCRDRARFGSWLLAILANRCRTLARRRARSRHEELHPEDAVARGGDFGDGLAWREEIRHALGRLEPRQREAFLLHYVDDWSYEEMAQVTGASVSALKMRAKRACDRLRLLLEEAF